MHRILLRHHDDPLETGTHVRITGEEARHALRVKRLEEGSPLQIVDGKGFIADAVLAGSEKLAKKGAWAIDARIEHAQHTGMLLPRVEVLSGVPKGPRLEAMVEGLSQAGAASWGPLISDRSVVDPRDAKLSRMDRVAEESLKQCGRSHLMEIRPRTYLRDLYANMGGVIVADASGEAYEPSGEDAITLLVGPEGGFTQNEIDRCRDAGAKICRFGSAVMRIEAAAVCACAIIHDQEQRERAIAGTPSRAETGATS